MVHEQSPQGESKYCIKKIDTDKHSIPLRATMKKGIIPKFPFSIFLCGRSGSGKTNLMMNLMTRKEFYKGYFHYIIVYSPTANVGDDLYKHLNLPDENIKNDFTSDDLNELIETRKQMIKDKGIQWVGKHSRVLIILDDVIADRNFLMSPTSLKMFCLLRHYLVSVIVMSQSYTKIPRALRLNVNATMIFPSTQSEIEVLLDEVTPAGIKKRDFERLIDYATGERFSFLYINNHAEPGERIRKNLDEVIDLNKYKT